MDAAAAVMAVASTGTEPLDVANMSMDNTIDVVSMSVQDGGERDAEGILWFAAPSSVFVHHPHPADPSPVIDLLVVNQTRVLACGRLVLSSLSIGRANTVDLHLNTISAADAAIIPSTFSGVLSLQVLPSQ